MADIKKELNDIKNAVYGKEVRGAIHDGIKKINDEVENATDLSESAKHQVENIQQQVNQLVIEGDSSVEAAQARVDADGNTFTTLKERLDTKETQFASRLAQTEQEINELPAQVASTNLNAFWEPPTQPHMDEVAPPTPIHPSSVFNLYDDLMSKDPTYISKEILGKDFTGLYDIPRYILKPKSYDKTIILVAGVHGNEDMAVKVLYRFIKHLVEDYADHPQLVYLRQRVRIVVIPIANPYGYANKVRYNGNMTGNFRVDINRNFDYRWDKWEEDTKGTAPLSEPETQYIDQTLQDFPDAVAYLDFHDIGYSVGEGFYIQSPRIENVEKNILYRIVNEMDNSAPLHFTKGIGPTSDTYASRNYGLHGLIVEWIPGGLGDDRYSSEDMTNAVKFFGNVIIQYAKLNKPIFEKVSEPKTIGITTTHLSVNSNLLDTWEEIPYLSITLNPKCDGIVEVIGTFTSHNADENAETHFTCVIIQEGHEYSGQGSISRQQQFHDTYARFGGKPGNLTVVNATSVYGTRGVLGDNHGNVEIKFYFKTNTGSISLRRNRILVKFTPTDDVNRYIEYIQTSSGELMQDYPKSYDSL